MVRVFVAVGLPQQVKVGLAGIRNDPNLVGEEAVRWVSEDGLHLTLKFLGEIPEDVVRPVCGALRQAVEGIKPFGLETSAFGFFPNAARAKVFWVGLKGDLGSLLLLHRQVEDALDSIGFRREEKQFSAHRTLARFKDNSPAERKRSFVEKAMKVRLNISGVIHVDGISLMKSTLAPTGAVYSDLARFRLEE